MRFIFGGGGVITAVPFFYFLNMVTLNYYVLLDEYFTKYYSVGNNVSSVLIYSFFHIIDSFVRRNYRKNIDSEVIQNVALNWTQL
jgi:hypothetical protein